MTSRLPAWHGRATVFVNRLNLVVPVMHLFGHSEGSWSFAACGELLGSMVLLQYRHARAFARPCKLCERAIAARERAA